MTDSALIHNTSLRSNDSTTRRLAVRLRLKKSNSQILQNPQSGPITTILQEQNNKLLKSTTKLGDINVQELSTGLKDYVDRVAEHYESKYEMKKQVFNKIMRQFRKELRFLAVQAEQVLGRETTSCGKSMVVSQTLPSNLEGSKALGSQILNNNSEKQADGVSSPQKQPPKLPRQKQNMDDDNKSIEQINKDLRSQISQMEHYIIRLKELVDQKDNIIVELNKKVGKMGDQIVDLKLQLDEQASRCKILEEEVLGYEHKIQQLQGKKKSGKKSRPKDKSMGESILSNSSCPDANLINLTESMYSDVEQYKRLEKQQDQKQNDQQKEQQQNVNQICHSSEQIEVQAQPQNDVGNQDVEIEVEDVEDKDEQESEVEEEFDYDDKQARALKLEQIYSKTQQALKKCKIMTEEINTKQSECSMLANKISIILSVIGIDQVAEVYTMQEGDLMLMVNKHIEKKLQKIKQEYNDRESKFEAMISLQLDEAITSIQEQITNKNQLEIRHGDTIFDKIQKISEVVKYILAMNSSGEYVDMLMAMYRKLEEIMKKSEEFKSDFTQNNKVLLSLCEELDKNNEESAQNGEIGPDFRNKLQIIENLLKQNEQLLQINEGEAENQTSGKLTGMNPAQVQSYLEELENVIKNIQKNQQKGHQKCKKQTQDLRQQLKQYLEFNSKTCNKIQQITNNFSQTDTNQQTILNMVQQLTQLSEKIKSFNKKDVKGQIELDAKTKEQVQGMRKKYLQDSPEFVDDIIAKLMKIKKEDSEQILAQVAESILDLIHKRDLRLKQEMGRKRELLKQRTAAIAQMCKQGMRDSSFESSMKKQ